MTTACVRTSGQSCALNDEEFDRNRVVQADGAQRFVVAYSGVGKPLAWNANEQVCDRHIAREIASGFHSRNKV